MTRAVFDPNAEPRLISHTGRERYACAARDCPMPGVIYPEGAQQGVCMWHYGESPSEWPAITGRMRDWRPVADAITAGRRVFIDPETCADIKAQNAAFALAGELMRHQIGAQWGTRFYPRSSDTYGQWVSRLTRLFTKALAGKLAPDVEALQ